MSSKRGGRGGRGPLPRNVQVSKKISWLLRHGAESEGLKLGTGGYVNVQDALNTKTLRSLKVTFAELREIVSTNDKQRFSLILASSMPVNASSSTSEFPEIPKDDAATLLAESLSQSAINDDDPASFLIRANQGHSIAVDVEGLLEPVTADKPLPEVVVHGTTHQAWGLILKSGGLMRMGRTHVHFAAGLPAGFKALDGGAGTDGSGDTQAPVISGMRNTSSVLIYVDIARALAAGIKFWRSENGVLLSEGDENGLIAVEYFKRVEERRRRLGVLMEDGKVVKELPADLANAEGRRVRGGRGRGKGGGRDGKPKLNVESGDIQALE